MPLMRLAAVALLMGITTPLVCQAGDTTEARSSATTNSVAQSVSPAPLLQAILGQIVEMHHEFEKGRASAEGANACKYEQKDYTEGAIVKVGEVAMLCVSRSSLVAETALNTEKQSNSGQQGDFNAPDKYLWEPLSSPRVARYRKLVGLPVHIR